MPVKIITVTTNTAIDYFVEIEQLSLGGNLLANHNSQFASGKGVNVAKTIATLNTEVQALGFVGQRSVGLFSDGAMGLIQSDFIAVPGQTRTNLTLCERLAAQETHIRTVGFSVTEADCQQLLEKIDAKLEAQDILILSGSLPPGAPVDLYQQLITLAHQKSAMAILDSSGEGFRQGLQAGPHLVKPNQAELAEVAGRPLETEQALIHAAYELIKWGSQIVVVSRGPQGLLMVTENNVVLKAYVNHLPQPVVSSVGCGDALVGGLAVGKLRQYTLLDSIKLGLGCATANLFSAEPGCFEQAHLVEIDEHLVIRSL